jgi:hypothetical protein
MRFSFLITNVAQQQRGALGVLCPTGDAAMRTVAAAIEISHQAIRIFEFKIVGSRKV